MISDFDIFVNNKLKSPPIAHRWHCFDVFFFWLSIEALKWIRSAFENGSKVMRRFTLLMDISSSRNETGLVALRTYVWEAVNVCCNNRTLIPKKQQRIKPIM